MPLLQVLNKITCMYAWIWSTYLPEKAQLQLTNATATCCQWHNCSHPASAFAMWPVVTDSISQQHQNHGIAPCGHQDPRSYQLPSKSTAKQLQQAPNNRLSTHHNQEACILQALKLVPQHKQAQPQGAHSEHNSCIAQPRRLHAEHESSSGDIDDASPSQKLCRLMSTAGQTVPCSTISHYCSKQKPPDRDSTAKHVYLEV